MKKKMTKLKTIRGVFLPMKALNWLMGCGESIEYPLGNHREKISFLYSLAWILFYYLMTYAHYIKQTATLKGDVTEVIFRTFFLTSYLLIVPETHFMAWKRRKELENIFKNIEKVDKLLWRLKIRNKYAQLYKKQIFLTIFTFTVVTTMVTVTWNFGFYPCKDCIFFIRLLILMKEMYPRILLLLNDFSFISYTICLEEKFIQLNDTLQIMSGTSYFCPQYKKVFNFALDINEGKSFKLEKKTNEDVEMIKIAKKAHLDLVKICKHINKIFRLHLLISLIDASIWLVYITYLAYIMFLVEGTVTINFIVVTTSWILSYLISIFGVNHICEKTSNEAMRTGRVICELHEPTTNKEFRSEIRDFTLQLIQSPLKFTAFGFITLNHSLIQDVIGSITTYLVVLIQLRDINKRTT